MKINLKQVGVFGMVKEITITNMVSRTGKTVPNQFDVFVYGQDGIYHCFYSYDSLIIVIKNGDIIKVGKDYRWSKTTGKYRNRFTGLTLKNLDKYIKENMNYNYNSKCWELN